MDGVFACHGCGACCTDLQQRWDRPATRFDPDPDTGIHRLPTPGGLRMFAWETGPFQDHRHRLHPLLAVADQGSQRLVALAYELEATRCPRYDDEEGCTVYADRPLVCQAYPLLVVQGAEGPEVSVSAGCMGRVPLALDDSVDLEEVLAQRYPDEAPAALSVPALAAHLDSVVAFLEASGALAPAPDPDLDAWRERDVVSLRAVVEASRVLTWDQLLSQVHRVTERVAERLDGAREHRGR